PVPAENRAVTTRATALAALLCAPLLVPARACADAPRVVVVPLEGAPIEGSVESVKDGVLRLVGRAAPVPLGEVRTLRFPAAAAPAGVVLEADKRRPTLLWADLVILHVDEPALAPPAGFVAEIDTVGGSRLIAEALEGDGQTWKVTTRSGLAIDVPASAIAEA